MSGPVQDPDYLSLLAFREELFQEELEHCARLLNGEEASLLPFVRDARGTYSEANTLATVRELADCALLWWNHGRRKIRASSRSEEERQMNQVLCAEVESFSTEERALVENFFYCALRVAETDLLQDLHGQDVSGATGTFGDLIRYADESYPDEIALFVAETEADAWQDNYASLKGLYRPASLLYRMFTGRGPSADYSPEVQRAWQGYLSADLQDRLARLHCLPAELGDRLWEGMDDLLLGEACFPQEAAWLREHFARPQEFVRRYRAFRETYYRPEYRAGTAGSEDDPVFQAMVRMQDLVGSLNWVVQGAVRVFTDRKGLCRFMDDESYFTATALLRRAVRRLAQGRRADG